jgi:pimeloyl-ACP methyl ester carboxylesterase
MIHVFHGFLGSPMDFDFLKRDGVILHDLYSLSNYPEVNKEDVLIGYSMGGRMALDLAVKKSFQIKKLILINAHPGLSTVSEKNERKTFEKVVLNALYTKSKTEFLDWWNNLTIFRFDRPITTSDERFAGSLKLFERFLLSEQPDFLPELITQKDKVTYVVGLLDEKYLELTGDKFLPHDFVIKGISGGHRLFQHPEELLSLFREEGIL